MTYNLINTPCLEIDGNLWTKATKLRNIYVIDNNVIFSKTSDNSEDKIELLVISIDIFRKCFGENILSSNFIRNPNSLTQNNKSIKFQFKVNQLTNDFHSIKPIGRGGFGRVYSAINKIDYQIYAIKKVIINCSKLNKKEISDTLKEFRILAKLNHGNIVRYHTAWFETIDELDWNSQLENSKHYSESSTNSVPKISQSSSFTNNPSINCSSLMSSNGSNVSSTTDNVISHIGSLSNSICDQSINNSQYSVSSHSDSNIVFEYSSNSNHNRNSMENLSSKEKYNGTLELCKSSKVNIPRIEFALYIQMEFCHLNLQDWLSNRNKQVGYLQDSDLKDVRCIARQLLKGVEYIHSNNVIHRDIKPANIFLTIHSTKDIQLKIGDFGLSKFFEFDKSEEVSITRKMKLTANTGTAFYSAPEVFNTKCKRIVYDHKCDLYSVGIILLELMIKFSTCSELCHVIEDISKGIEFKDLKETWPLEDPFVRNLISLKPQNRPEASFILNQTCCFKESYVPNGLYDHYKYIMSENSNLKSENSNLKSENSNLKSENSKIKTEIELLRQRLESLLFSQQKN